MITLRTRKILQDAKNNLCVRRTRARSRWRTSAGASARLRFHKTNTNTIDKKKWVIDKQNKHIGDRAVPRELALSPLLPVITAPTPRVRVDTSDLCYVYLRWKLWSLSFAFADERRRDGRDRMANSHPEETCSVRVWRELAQHVTVRSLFSGIRCRCGQSSGVWLWIYKHEFSPYTHTVLFVHPRVCIYTPTHTHTLEYNRWRKKKNELNSKLK